MNTPPRNFMKSREYGQRVSDTDYNLGSVKGEQEYEDRLTKTLQNLQGQIEEHKIALETVTCSQNAGSIDK